jgi:hypothetical protein
MPLFGRISGLRLTQRRSVAIIEMRLRGLHQRSIGSGVQTDPLGRLAFSGAGHVHLLYLDDSGSADNKSEEYLVLGGVSLFEAQVNWTTNELDKLAEGINPKDPQSVEFHASEIFSGRTPPWNAMSRDERQGVIKNVLKIFASSYDSARAFACAIHKDSYPGHDPMELAFEDLCSRFDHYLSDLRQDGERQRGILILDESAYETSLQKLAADFRLLGTRWRVIQNLAEAPLFIKSHVSRSVQLADHIAYAVFRRYNARDTTYLDIIASKFHSVDGVMHGLSHKQNIDRACMCPACLTRSIASRRPVAGRSD